ncbi:DgyrCDS223 [Dimorphilus gyrociliatus]|uniref:DgyrCDS223 n=1 Tax=Dimorphilus gyrociliatus TaxID=2664684 RepID=A0A7I8V5N3_9ANNE|nr:DgyrCDS223 [Dimorphilus gyrociliatus]
MDNSDQESSTLLLSPSETSNAPKDRLKFVYAIFYLLGIGTMLPWNFFINGKHYFMYKLRNTTLPTNFTHYDEPKYETEFQVSFESYLAIAAMLPTVLFMFLNAVATRLIRLRIRMVIAAVTMILIFAVTLTFVILDTDRWQVEFFAITLVCIVIMNAASAVLQGGVFGLASMFPPKYSQSVMAGQGMGGTLAAVANIISIAATKNASQSGLFYFTIALVVLLMALVAYLVLPCIKFARYHTDRNFRQTISSNDEDNTVDTSEDLNSISFSGSNSTPLLRVFRMISKYAFSVSIIFFVTLACFPAITSSIAPALRKEGNRTVLVKDEWRRKYFTPVICFLLFNVFDLVGRTIAGFYQWPKFKSNLLPLFCILRIGFIPLFVFCNVQPRLYLVTYLFQNDVAPAVIMVFFALSNGYLSTLCMMYGPMNANEEDEETAGALMPFFLALGLSAGSFFSFLLLHYMI